MPIFEYNLTKHAPITIRIYILVIRVCLAFQLSYIFRHEKFIIAVRGFENRQRIISISLPCIIPAALKILTVNPMCLIYRIETENDTLADSCTTAQTLFKLLNICIVGFGSFFYPTISNNAFLRRDRFYFFNILLRCVIAVSAITLYITIEFRLYLQKSYSLVGSNSMPPISTSLEAYSTR